MHPIPGGSRFERHQGRSQKTLNASVVHFHGRLKPRWCAHRPGRMNTGWDPFCTHYQGSGSRQVAAASSRRPTCADRLPSALWTTFQRAFEPKNSSLCPTGDDGMRHEAYGIVCPASHDAQVCVALVKSIRRVDVCRRILIMYTTRDPWREKLTITWPPLPDADAHDGNKHPVSLQALPWRVWLGTPFGSYSRQLLLHLPHTALVQRPLDAWFAVPSDASHQVVYAPQQMNSSAAAAAEPLLLLPQHPALQEALDCLKGCRQVEFPSTCVHYCHRQTLGSTDGPVQTHLPAARSIAQATNNDPVVVLDASLASACISLGTSLPSVPTPSKCLPCSSSAKTGWQCCSNHGDTCSRVLV